jgi:glycogen operon protein
VLARWGVLSSKVLVFERDFHTGRFRDASNYPRLALATVDTHDLPPLVGWLEQRDIILRSEVGDLADLEQQRAMRESRTSDRNAMIEMLIDAELLPASARENVRSEPLIAALHTFIRSTPAALVGLSLDDLAREAEPVNIPGIWQDKYPSWSRRMRETLERLLADPGTTAMLGEGPESVAVPSPS